MRIDQLEKFCAPAGFHPTASWQEKPFAIDNWRVATDGYILIADGEFNQAKLPQLEESSNKEMIREWLNFPIGGLQYSTEHLSGFCEAKFPKISTEYFKEPAMFFGYRVDVQKIRKVLTIAPSSYQYSVRKDSQLNHCFHFRFGRIVALIMGLRNADSSDAFYEPKEITIQMHG